MKNFKLVLILLSVNLLVKAQSLDFVMDFVSNNPGEKPFETKYNNPEYLRSQGFNAMVTYWHVNCAITYDSFDKDVVRQGTKEREWIEGKAKKIRQKLTQATQQKIEVFPFTDFLVFPQSIWEKYGKQIASDSKSHALGGKKASHKPNMQSKLLQKLVVAQVDEIFRNFPELGGLTLRFGETYLHDTPYHRGGSPIRNGYDGIEDHVMLISILRKEICEKRNKKLIYRTWDFNYFHVNPDFYLRVTDQIEPHENLMFSIKYQQGDFHRMTPFNPCIGKGKHRQIIESQSRLEAYGKAAHPYYTAPGVINGWPETKYQIESQNRMTETLNPKEHPRGLRDILKNGLLAGVMTWSHGGGWKGPFIKHEIWTDLNTYVVSQWAQDIGKSEEDLFYEFASKLGLSGYQADLFRTLNILTIEGVRKGQLNSFTNNKVWWTRDQYFSASANKGIIKEVIEKDLTSKVLAEKREATFIWHQIEALSRQFEVNDKATQEAIEVSCTYGRIKYELIEQMWIMMIYHQLSDDKEQKSILRNALSKYDKLWVEWNDLYKSSPYCATIYTDKYLWDRREGSIGEFVDNLREELKGPAVEE